MFDVIVRYYMRDAEHYVTDFTGITTVLMALNMLAVSTIEITARSGD